MDSMGILNHAPITILEVCQISECEDIIKSDDHNLLIILMKLSDASKTLEL